MGEGRGRGRWGVGRAYSDGSRGPDLPQLQGHCSASPLDQPPPWASMLHKFVPTTHLLGPGGGCPPNVLLGAAEGYSFPSTGLMKLLLELELILAMGLTRNPLRRQRLVTGQGSPFPEAAPPTPAKSEPEAKDPCSPPPKPRALGAQAVSPPPSPFLAASIYCPQSLSLLQCRHVLGA